MLANQPAEDHSLAMAISGSKLASNLVTQFIRNVQETNQRYADVNDETILKQWGCKLDSGETTYAGMLALGENPEKGLPAARITYRRHPREEDPPDTKYSGTHYEGTYGEILEQVMRRFSQDLEKVQVVRDGNTLDELDVPKETLREVLSNALVHRSLAYWQREISILVEVTDEAVIVTSPGGLISTVDTSTLGLSPLGGVRNPTLIRLCEQVTTPSGWHIVEHQGTGIATADKICRRNQTMPIVFLDGPASFVAIMLRGSLNLREARTIIEKAILNPSEDQIRVIAVLNRLNEIRKFVAVTSFNGVNFDAHFAARSLSSTTVEDAASILRKLEDFGVLVGHRSAKTPCWKMNESAMNESAMNESAMNESNLVPIHPLMATAGKIFLGKQNKEAFRLWQLLKALKDSPARELLVRDIGAAMELSEEARNKWLNIAERKGLIKSTVDNQMNPKRGFRITSQGEAMLESLP